jgi:hypothetical protein
MKGFTEQQFRRHQRKQSLLRNSVSRHGTSVFTEQCSLASAGTVPTASAEQCFTEQCFTGIGGNSVLPESVFYGIGGTVFYGTVFYGHRRTVFTEQWF